MRYLLDTNMVSDLVRKLQGKVAQRIFKRRYSTITEARLLWDLGCSRR